MAYADQQMSGNKITALIVVAILHVAVGYALVTGLAQEAFKKVKEVTSAVNIEEEKPPEEPPPPPPPKENTPPPPIVAPPPPISFNAPAPQVQTVNEAPPMPAPPAPVALPAPPAAPPPPRFTPKAAVPKGQPGNWATSNDYPSRALREEREGTTGFRVTIGTDGKVTDCQITRSSGSPDLDEATCSNVRRRARFQPATDGEGQPTTGSYSNSIRWVIPKD
ncbi:energy transducer TonB [Novosphingobium taihuense]|uniref:Protein TonB n=1 Tax=Novosphingobium taihuense TaxID=260085 RepID=A0A7W7EWN9_9SPHN|nr:energy transducer TonB [Novosphingobium taihuense]MBB4614495.1 protein TonB [Novosphingobium taihuense]TWH86262.1 outer membrane transport energization protein TonB [Novosphingobium taihuense]